MMPRSEIDKGFDQKFSVEEKVSISTTVLPPTFNDLMLGGMLSIWRHRWLVIFHKLTPMNHSNKDGISSAESEEGRLLIKENTLPSGRYPTLSGSARVPRVGECADKLFAWPLFIRDKSRMR
jgi:hypothetical protein